MWLFGGRKQSTTVQKFIDHLLHKDVVDSGILEDLGMNENQDKKRQKDPRLTMEMRHKQVGGKAKLKWITGSNLGVTHLISLNKDLGFIVKKGAICGLVRKNKNKKYKTSKKKNNAHKLR